jgi:hypothetical protein
MRCPICDRLLNTKAERKKDLCNVCKAVVSNTMYEMEQDDHSSNVPDKFVVKDFDKEKENG